MLSNPSTSLQPDCYLLIEDKRVISMHSSESDAVKAMNEEHKKDVYSMLAKRWILNKFLSGKYKLKEYTVVKVACVRSISNDDETLGGIF